MAEVKWIKITTDMFDNRKIKHLRRLPDGNNIVLIWVMLLTMAGRCNSGGMIFLTENIPYTPKMLADELDFEENTVRLALEALERLGMVVTSNGCFTIAGWSEHQNIEGMERIREQTKKRVQKYRAEQKLLQGNVTSNVTVTQSNATDIERELEREREKEKDTFTVSNDTVCRTDVQQIVDAWNSLGLSKITKIVQGKNRDKLLKARIKEYGRDRILEAIEKVKNSDFLKGQNKDGWTITFDWFIRPNNFPKVLDGNYDNKHGAAVSGRKEKVPSWMGKKTDDAWMKQYISAPKTVQDDPALAERASRLKEKLGEAKTGS